MGEGIELRGVIPPLVTPLDPNGNVDAESLKRLVDFVIRGGVSGIFVLGSTGEGAYLPPRQQVEAAAAALEAARGRVSVLGGVLCPGTPQAVARARALVRAGVDAVVLTAPYYYSCTADELERHFREVRQAVDSAASGASRAEDASRTEPRLLQEFLDWAQARIVAMEMAVGEIKSMTKQVNLIVERISKLAGGILQGPEKDSKPMAEAALNLVAEAGAEIQTVLESPQRAPQSCPGGSTGHRDVRDHCGVPASLQRGPHAFRNPKHSPPTAYGKGRVGDAGPGGERPGRCHGSAHRCLESPCGSLAGGSRGRGRGERPVGHHPRLDREDREL